MDSNVSWTWNKRFCICWKSSLFQIWFRDIWRAIKQSEDRYIRLNEMFQRNDQPNAETWKLITEQIGNYIIYSRTRTSDVNICAHIALLFHHIFCKVCGKAIRFMARQIVKASLRSFPFRTHGRIDFFPTLCNVTQTNRSQLSSSRVDMRVCLPVACRCFIHRTMFVNPLFSSI